MHHALTCINYLLSQNSLFLHGKSYYMHTQRPFQEEDITADVITEKEYQLILWNDEVNTFDWVITSLIEICDHSPEQAEQCALLVHYKGKCAVKNGSFELLHPRAEAFIDRGIQATIS